MPKAINKTGLIDDETGAETSKPLYAGESFNPTHPTLPRIKLSLRLLHGEEIALGPGKADLLEAIARTGSISAAGRSMNMSYRRAWMLVDVMNRCFKTPLVETAKGGSHGGGARLSLLGKEVLAHYRVMDTAAKQVASAYLRLFENLMGAPPAQNGADNTQGAAFKTGFRRENSIKSGD